jgi:hypothetical protein
VRVIIAGSLSFEPTLTVVENAVAASQYDVTEVITGGVHGVDGAVERYARSRKLRLHRFSDDEVGAKYQGMIRHADGLIAICDGTCVSTKILVNAARSHRLLVSVHKMEQDYGKPTCTQIRV